MCLFRKLQKTKSGSRPADDTAPSGSSSPSQPSSSTIVKLKNRLRLHKQPVQDSDQSGSSAMNPRPGFFTGASHFHIDHGNFIDAGRDVIIHNEIKDNELLLLDRLPHVKHAGYRSGNRDACLTDTRIEELRRIEDWEADVENKRVYWLNGAAGTGKSAIAQTFAQRSSLSNRLGASFFCSRDFEDRSDINLIFPTLAFHLACRYTEFKSSLIQILNSTPNAGHESLALQLENLIVRPLQSTRLSTTIIIDALDECKDNQPASAILSLLGRHLDEIPLVKFFITGRPEIPIRTGFRLRLLRPHTEVFVLHEVDRESVDQDIRLYIHTRLSEIVAERSRFDVDVVWPTAEEIDAVVTKCSGVFIVASVTVKFVISPHHSPQERLKIITGTPDSTVNEGKSGVDATYDQIFLQSFEDVKTDVTEFFDRLRLIVGSIALVLNPLSCASLAAILDMSPDDVSNTIRSLHSVIMVPNSDLDPLRVVHKSFPDYLTDKTRCTDPRFHIDPSIYHMKVGMCCLALMNKSLKRNICDLPAYAMNKDIDDLGVRRSKHIGSGLEYACRSWARHICNTSKDDDIGHVMESLELFFQHHLLSWLEVLSIIGDLRRAIYSLGDLKAWLVNVELCDTKLSAMVKDSERFVLRFFDVIEESAAHIYHSTLPWCPTTSLVREQYRDCIPTEVTLLNSIDDSWDACTRVIQTGHFPSSIGYSHKDGLVVVAKAHCVGVFEAATGLHLATLATDSLRDTIQVSSAAFSSDDTLVVTGHLGEMVQVWDLQTGGLVCALEGHSHPVMSVAFSPCGTMIASGSEDSTVRIWNLTSYTCQCVLKGHSDTVYAICWSSAGHEVVSGCKDGAVWVWDVLGMKCSKTLAGHSKAVRCVAYSPDSSRIASGSEDGTVNVYGTGTNDVFQTISTSPITSIRFSTLERLMYTTGDSTFVIWDVTKQAEVSLFKYDGDEAAISSDGASIASGNVDCIKIWHTDITSQNHDVARHSGPVRSVAFSEDGRFIASGSADKTVRLWDPNSGLCLHTFEGHSSYVTLVTFSPDSRFCASSSDDHTTRIWDVHALAVISVLNIHSNQITFSPDSCQFLSVRWVYPADGSPASTHLILCEVEAGKSLAEMTVADDFVPFVFDIDGTIRNSSAKDGSPSRWRISPAPSPNHESSIEDNENVHSTLPMVFVPIHDEQQQHSAQSIFPAIAPCHYRALSKGWILDEQDRRVLWLPPDLAGFTVECYEKKVVIGSHTGRVTIVHFSDGHAGRSI